MSHLYTLHSSDVVSTEQLRAALQQTGGALPPAFAQKLGEVLVSPDVSAEERSAVIALLNR